MKPLAVLFLCVHAWSCPVFAGEAKAPLHLTLAQALAQAQTVSVGVLVADARVQQALARLSQARAPLLPQIDGTVSGARQTRDLRSSGIVLGAGPHIGPFNSFDARGKITQTIFDAGAFERLRAAKAGERLSASQLEKAREDALALVATMYIQAQRAQQYAGLTKVFLKRDRKALELAQVSYKQGTGSLLELKKAQSDHAQSRYAHRAALADAVQKRLDVAAALRIGPEVPVIFEEDNYRSVLVTMVADQDSIVPDVQVALDQLKEQKAQASAARADYLPRITAMADYGRSGEVPDNASNTYTIGVQANIPIWEGGSKQAAVAEAKARVKEAGAVLEDAELHNAAQVIEAKENIAQARMLIMAKNAQLSAAGEQMSVALKRLEQGTGHELDVDIAAAQQAQAQDERREAAALLWTAKISLAHALGQMRELRGHPP